MALRGHQKPGDHGPGSPGLLVLRIAQRGSQGLRKDSPGRVNIFYLGGPLHGTWVEQEEEPPLEKKVADHTYTRVVVRVRVDPKEIVIAYLSEEL